ncbi:MAG: hypothetical protein E7256_08445 [Lachnospiraceae bacterium]|nr:hypothetical protein [Lachnospiraceae bacterium]
MEYRKETCTGKRYYPTSSSPSDSTIPEAYAGNYPANGIFPAKPFHGMQIFYSISHAAIHKQDDFIGKDAERVLIGHSLSSHLELNGYVEICSAGGCLRATIQVSLTDIANPENTEISYLILSPSETAKQPFHICLDLSPAISEAYASVVIVAEFESCTRYLKLSGKLKNEHSCPVPPWVPPIPEAKPVLPPCFLSDDTRIDEHGTLLWKCATLTDGPGGFPTGSYQISEEGFILLEKVSGSSIYGTYFGIPELYGSGSFLGVIREEECVKQIIIEANWHGNPPYYCKETFEPGKLRIAFTEDGNRFHMNYSQCGEPATLSGPPRIGYLVYPNFYPLDGMYWEYNEMPGQQIPKEGILRTLLNPISPGLLSNSILGFYDHNKGSLNGKIVGNVLLCYFFYSLKDDSICYGEACFLFDPYSQCFIATWNPAGSI